MRDCCILESKVLNSDIGICIYYWILCIIKNVCLFTYYCLHFIQDPAKFEEVEEEEEEEQEKEDDNEKDQAGIYMPCFLSYFLLVHCYE